MAEELQKIHMYYDDINKIRILETNVTKETEALMETCKEYDISKFIGLLSLMCQPTSNPFLLKI